MWRNTQDNDIQAVLRNCETVDFCGDVIQTGNRVDWAQCLINITCVVMRGLSQAKYNQDHEEPKGVVELRFI